MNDEERWFKNTSGLDAEGLCNAYGECDKPFVEMGKYGSWIDIGEFAAIQQSERLAFSVEFNEETDEITIFDGENFEHKGLTETLLPQKAEPKAAPEKENPADKTSLKSRLAEKKAFVSGQEKDHEVQENVKKNQREV